MNKESEAKIRALASHLWDIAIDEALKHHLSPDELEMSLHHLETCFRQERAARITAQVSAARARLKAEEAGG